MEMNRARLAPSLSWSRAGMVDGEVHQAPLPEASDDGRNFDSRVLTSLNVIEFAVSRWPAPWPPPPVVMVAGALKTPSGLPTPLPCRNAYSSYQATARAKSCIRNFSRPNAASCSRMLLETE